VPHAHDMPYASLRRRIIHATKPNNKHYER